MNTHCHTFPMMFNTWGVPIQKIEKIKILCQKMAISEQKSGPEIPIGHV